MNDFLKKHWITLLGALFIFLSFSYLFKYAVDQGWISYQIKIGLGLLVGSGLILIGFKLFSNQKDMVSQIITGLGVALLYTTFSFAGIFYSLWNPMTVFLAMIVVTIGLAVFAFKNNLRILMNVSILGGLISPIVMKPVGDQVFTLFLYLLVVNTVFFFLSVKKSWTELRLISFLGTWYLFSTYYFWFDPDTWVLPIRYAISAYLFYVIGFMISSWKDNMKFTGLNLYLGIVNAVVFGLWSLWILDGVVSYTVPLAGMGMIYILVSIFVYYLTRDLSVPVLTKFVGGVLLLLVAVSDIGSGSAMKPIYSVYLWTMMAIFLLVVGQIRKMDYAKLLSAIMWFTVGVYWFAVTWDAPIGEWFGVFIPFLNWSGMAWVLLAALGFYFSLQVQFHELIKKPEIQDTLSNFFSIASHLIVGGLLTFQIENLWKYYSLKFLDIDLSLSISWGIYAMLLFLWGAYSKQSVFRWFGSIVLVMVAAKTIFLDLSGVDTIYKILVLFILGVITFGISYINNQWKQEDKPELKQEESSIETV